MLGVQSTYTLVTVSGSSSAKTNSFKFQTDSIWKDFSLSLKESLETDKLADLKYDTLTPRLSRLILLSANFVLRSLSDTFLIIRSFAGEFLCTIMKSGPTTISEITIFP